jgi:hypothetical protein
MNDKTVDPPVSHTANTENRPPESRRSAHTPGPWRFALGAFNNPSHDDKSGAIVAGEDEWNIAEVCGDVWEHEANARLIAAAPELLELLRESQDYIGGDWRERREALIARVEGYK